MKKMLFIYNPKAGKAQIRNKLADILDVFTKGDYEITVYPTQKSEDAMEKTRDRSKDYDIVVCSGGDGTLDEVVTGMIRSGFRTPIGYTRGASRLWATTPITTAEKCCAPQSTMTLWQAYPPARTA